MRLEQWMNASGIAGTLIFLLTYLFLARGWADPQSVTSRALRGVGLALILVPLFLSWYLNDQQLVLCGLMMAAAGGYYAWRGR